MGFGPKRLAHVKTVPLYLKTNLRMTVCTQAKTTVGADVVLVVGNDY